MGIFILFFSFLVRKILFAGIELTSQRVRGLRGTSELPGRPATHYNIYVYIYIYIYIILFKRGMSIVSVCTFISTHGFLNATCPLDPGFDAMYLVTVQWRQN